MNACAEEIAWAAGLFEGEGCISFLTRSEGRPILNLTSADKDVVSQFHAVVGCGTITSRPPAREGWKPTWRWYCGAAAEVLAVLGAFWPYLGERRQQKATEALERAAKIGQGRGRRSDC